MSKHRRRNIPGEITVEHIEAKLAQEFTLRAVEAARFAPRTEILAWSDAGRQWCSDQGIDVAS